MNKQETILKKKKSMNTNKFSALFADKKKRYLYMFLFMLPFIIAIGIFGFIAYKEAKNLISVAKGTETEVKDENSIPSMRYILRDNATDLQKEYFAELKKAIEEENAAPLTIAELVAKNYIADFYTWTNKQGQYDVGGFSYVFDGRNENIEFKNNAYVKARDGFYKYINYYMNKYGADKLLEVESIEITASKQLDYKYTIHQWIETVQTGDETYDVIYDDAEYDAYLISCKWTYKPNEVLKLSDFGNSLNLIVVNDNGRYEISETSVTSIDARPKEESESEASEQDSENTETEAGTSNEE